MVPPLQRRDDTDVCHRGVAAGSGGGGGGGGQQKAAGVGHSYTWVGKDDETEKSCVRTREIH